ncbi:glycosyltransferase family 4 protein [Gilvimarinus sp. DA14]|uniref:MraY family glycosyltransferase n=1 Tax=Gilvimarinus sp. DA14 TaxID=2956798 RepID=UPI0020B81CEB|nr:glycosyltransferase family 4 protein [Gilvimarinus sp. DA14]UTF60746.1 glycosyltransferase family 4 protein [Gilvimarinus sp. DA14]
MMFDLLDFVALLVAFLSAYGLTGVIRRYALARDIIDVPGSRSSHIQTTPRAGGASIVAVALAACGAGFWADRVTFPGVLLVPLVLIAVVGLVDDIKNVSAFKRLCVQLLAAAFIVYFFPLPELALPGIILPPLLVSCLALIAVVWSVNLFNFMDGINGIASLQAVFVFLGFAILVATAAPEANISPGYWLLLAAACVGFLLWNFPVAKIFMGDCCSGFLGLMVALGLIDLLCISQRLFVAGLILHGVFIIDATATLLVRLFTGEQVQSAHRDHAYQKASRYFDSHTKVTLGVAALNFFWLAPWALLVALSVVPGWLGLPLAYLAPLGLALCFKAGIKTA